MDISRTPQQGNAANTEVAFKPDSNGTASEAGFWKVLIVDDEKDVHAVTDLALRNFSFEDKPLRLLHAHSGSEALKIMEDQPDVAVILLDVVMESDDAGLTVATRIRTTLDNHLVRIILRTGQTGLFPEQQVVAKYEVNDYKAKTELTAQKLSLALLTSLRNYRDLVMLDKSHRTTEVKLLSNITGSLIKYRAWKNTEGSNKKLEEIFQAGGSIADLPSVEQFMEGLISQTTALLHARQNALHSRTKTEGRTTADDEFSEYDLVQSVQIPDILREMRKQDWLVTLFFNHGMDSLLTSVLDFSPDNKTMIFRQSSDAEANRRLFHADKIHCVSSNKMVKICFTLNSVKSLTHKDHDVFITAIPDVMFRLQRREYHRLTVPLSKPLRVNIPLPQKEGPTKTIQVVLFDISCGGVCFIGANIENDITVGNKILGVNLDLPNVGLVKFDIYVRSIHDMTAPGGKILRRFGCEFINLPGAMFNLIQHYIASAERMHLPNKA